MEQAKSVVFLSWSGPRSKAVALALRSWLKKVLQAVDPWMSEQDIQAGQIWFNEVADKLEASAFAVICVTPENVTKPWLNFEAGAIGMARREGTHRLAAPYVLGLDELGVLPQPLGAFEAKKADKDGTLGLVESINKTLPNPLEAAVLKEIFEMWWPQLEVAIQAIPAQDDGSVAAEGPTPDDKLDELLGLMRSIASNLLPSSDWSATYERWMSEVVADLVANDSGGTPFIYALRAREPGSAPATRRAVLDRFVRLPDPPGWSSSGPTKPPPGGRRGTLDGDDEPDDPPSPVPAE